MNIEVGKFYKTRGGRKVRIYATDGLPLCSVHGAWYRDTYWCQINWQCDGVYVRGEEHHLDIVAEWSEPIEVWVLWRGYAAAYYTNKHSAQYAADMHGGRVVKLVESKE